MLLHSIDVNGGGSDDTGLGIAGAVYPNDLDTVAALHQLNPAVGLHLLAHRDIFALAGHESLIHIGGFDFANLVVTLNEQIHRIRGEVVALQTGLDADGGVLNVGMGGHQLVAVGVHFGAGRNQLTVFVHLVLEHGDGNVTNGEDVGHRRGCGQVGDGSQHGGHDQHDGGQS